MIASETARNVLNFLLFQAGWFACVFYPGLIGAGIAVFYLYRDAYVQKELARLNAEGFGVARKTYAGTLDPDRPVGIDEHLYDIICVERGRDGAATGRP